MKRVPTRPLRAAAAALGLSSSLACSDADCRNTILRDLPSPDGRRHAVVFTRDCGATTGFSTQVSILPGTREPSGGGNVFTSDTDHDAAPAGAGGGPAVVVRWLDGRTVEIRYHPKARVFTRESRHDDTDIRYVPDSTLGSTT
ncbi:MAG TPA: hypothetical protein VF761_13370 [Gemmatimonadaceae bacterium]